MPCIQDGVWVQNFHLLWLDAGADHSNEDCQGKLAQLQCIVNDVNLFTKRDECIDFLTEVEGKKAFLLIEGAIGQRILPLIHDIPQLDRIYFISRKTSRYEQWTKEWVKVQGVHTEMTSIIQSSTTGYQAMRRKRDLCKHSHPG